MKEIFTLGCCGLDCGLCPRFYTQGSSRCPGCCGPGFAELHPSCSFVTCCAKKQSREVCALCGDFPCDKFRREDGETDSFVTHRKIMPNQEQIRSKGINEFLAQQSRRREILKTMLDDYDDGRSKSFFCLAAAVLPLPALNRALDEAEREMAAQAAGAAEVKAKNKILTGILNKLAQAENMELKLRKGRHKLSEST